MMNSQLDVQTAQPRLNLFAPRAGGALPGGPGPLQPRHHRHADRLPGVYRLADSGAGARHSHRARSVGR